MIKKLLSLLIVACMVLSPVCYAAEEQDQEILFHDDFTEQSSKWSIEDNASSIDTANGTMDFDDTADSTDVLVNAGPWESYCFETEFIPNSLEYFGFYTRYSDADNHVLLKIFGREKSIKLLQKVNGGYYTKEFSKKYNFKYGEKYKLAIKVYGKKLELYINDELIGESEQITVGSGKIGFTSLESDVTVNDVRVTKVNDVYIDPKVGKKKTIYVSPSGNDNGNGSKEEPVKTIEAAKELAKIRKIGNNPVEVVFEEGEYNISKTIAFGSNDSGSVSAPITYRAENGKKVVFNAAKKLEIKNFEQITDKNVAERINKKAKGKVLQYDLSKTGLADSVYDMQTGAELTYPYYPADIYFNSSRQDLSRWPNDGWHYFTDVVDEGGTAQSVWQGKAKTDDVITKGAIFKYTELNPSQWKSIDGAYLAGFFGTEYRSEWTKIDSIDQLNQEIKLANYTVYGVKRSHRWSVVNLLDEIDIPGEWCIDQNKKMLYYYPQHTLTNDDVIEISGMTGEILNFSGAENIVFDGIDIEKSRSNGIVMSGSKNITISNCKISGFTYAGIDIEDCSNLTISGNIMSSLGRGAVNYKKCGDMKNLIDSNILIENNVVHNIALNDDYGGGISPFQGSLTKDCVGVTIRNNTISKSDAQVLHAVGSNIDVSYNEVYNVVRNVSDAGAIYNGRSFCNYDNRIEYNYIHDLGSIDATGTYSVNGIFLDDLESGITIKNNIIFPNNPMNTSGIKIGGGRDNTVQYNIIGTSVKPILGENRNATKTIDYIFNFEAYTTMQKNMKNGINYLAAPWNEKHPGIAAFIKDVESENGYLPKNNCITDNVYYKNYEEEAIASRLSELGKVENNKKIDDDIFVDSSKQDYRIKDDAKKKYGLADELIGEDFDMNSIGSNLDITVDKGFELLYPENSQTDVECRDLWLRWENKDFTDEYEYVVATDKELKDVVESGRTLTNTVQLKNLKNGQTYYWKVTAKNLSRRLSDAWDSPSGVFSFKTAEADTVITTPLKNLLYNAEKSKSDIKEGTADGLYKVGTKSLLDKQIKEATNVYNNKSAKQDEIDSAYSKLSGFVSTIKKYINLGYQKLVVASPTAWKVSNSDADISVGGSTGTVEISRNNATASTVYYDKKYSSGSVLCFDMNIDNFNGSWAGIALRQTEPTALPYLRNATSSYLIVVKEDAIELQRYNVSKADGGIIETVPNSFIRSGSWHNVEFGAVPAESGVYITFKVDGADVFSYFDTSLPYYDDGYFTVFPQNGGKISIRETSAIPEGKFEIPQKVEKIYDTANSFIAEGNWTKEESKGYEGSTLYSTNDKTANAKWLINEGKGIANYKVYIYHDPSVNTDANAQIKITNYATDEVVDLDMTSLNAGWYELGEYQFISESVTKECSFEFIPSGNGNLSISAIKLVEQN